MAATTKEVAMTDATSAESTTAAAAAPVLSARDILLADLRTNVSLCERTSKSKEPRYLARALRKISSLRKSLDASVLSTTLTSFLPASVAEPLVGVVVQNSEGMEVTDDAAAATTSKDKTPITSVVPEVESYLHLLTVVFLLDKKNNVAAKDVAITLIQRFQQPAFNLRTLDQIFAKAYYYYSRTFELTSDYASIRATLLSAYRTACLRHDLETQGTLLNLLLRNYLSFNLVDQADKLVEMTKRTADHELALDQSAIVGSSLASHGTFDEATASSNQHARYLYYTGRIQAIKLSYSQSYESLAQALRKAPQNSALGFRCTVHKLSCIVKLLLGEIPEKSLFRQAGFTGALRPYYLLSESVRVGDLAAFHQVVQSNEAQFRKDNNLTLIQRLRRNVIKTGLRKINLSYSRISFTDICNKLHLENDTDAEYIVAKAIRDGVIDATIDHEQGYVRSKEVVDVYSTYEPQDIFHQRIKFCLKLHNDAVMAMRFPPDAYKNDKETEEARKERLKQEAELAQEIAEEDDDDDDDIV